LGRGYLNYDNLNKRLNILFLVVITIRVFIPGEMASGQAAESVWDGPYLFIDNNNLKSISVRNGVVKYMEVDSVNFNLLRKRYDLRFSYNDIFEKYHSEPENQSFTRDGSIAIMSDLHGEYDNYIKLLKRTGIIDQDLNWSFGKGQLVILGDIFDRGPMVTEILWHLFGLEMQAADAGGKVHILLGNHEYMILTGDDKFINNKYRNIEQITGKSYSDFFVSNSVLGNWLQKMPVVIKINNMLFTHAGISTDLVREKTDIDQMNRIYRDILTGRPDDGSDLTSRSMKNTQLSEMLFFRGYFTDDLFSESKLDSVLTFYGVKRIIVGHTTLSEVKSMYHDKLIGIDAGLMYYHSGEMLLYENGEFYRVLFNGQRKKIFEIDPE